MIKHDHTLAKINWHLGQQLAPEHFTAQEQAFYADTLLRLQQFGLPLEGVIDFDWDDELLEKTSLIKLKALTYLLPDGTLFKLGNNTHVNTLPLQEIHQREITLYLNYLGEEVFHERINSNKVERKRFITQLAINTLDNAHISLPLAQLEKTISGHWAFKKSYLPPTIRLTKNTLTQPFFYQLDSLIIELEEGLKLSLSSSIDGLKLLKAQQCLKSVYLLKQYIDHLNQSIKPHPYYLYENISQLYLDTCFYFDIIPEPLSSYNHHKLYETLIQPIEKIKSLFSHDSERIIYLEFKSQDGYLLCKNLPDNIYQASHAYILVQKQNAHDDIHLNQIKFASLSRLSLAYKLSLPGLPIKKLANLPFQHGFGANVDFYQVDFGLEWDNIMKEKAICFYDHTEFSKTKFYLYFITHN
ncbi:type VI secretion system baseplate subunit TssK [Piscirickettsia salmonis]|uniref:type VI secretion system baseplate subunit TssK n=1 Tax=Piscirickettsia salmonis TaxID=1238 RepID=UPI000F07D959|nr:hypothetical protein DA717_09925 [Piscirickettsiaceae bacterium NZ-RLO2]